MTRMKKKALEALAPVNGQRFINALLETFNEVEENIASDDVENNWRFLWDNLLRATGQICG